MRREQEEDSSDMGLGGPDGEDPDQDRDGAARRLTRVHREALAAMDASDGSEAGGGTEARGAGSACGSTGVDGQRQGSSALPHGGLGARLAGDHVPETGRGLPA